MTNPSSRPAKGPPSPVKLRLTSRFEQSFEKKSRGLPRSSHPRSGKPVTKLDLAVETFVEHKIQRPPRLLPKTFKDHRLKGALSWCRECHLAGDALLLYTLDAGALTLLVVVDHDELAGPRGKALARQLRTLRDEG